MNDGSLKSVKIELSMSKIIRPVPARPCHVIYYHGDKKCPCIFGKEIIVFC